MLFCLGKSKICKTVSETLNGIFLPFSQIEAPIHLDIESLLNSIYLLQANTERLDVSTKFFLEAAKLPFELNLDCSLVGVFRSIDDLVSI